VALAVLGPLLYVVSGLPPIPGVGLPGGATELFLLLLRSAAFVVMAILGALIASRYPRNPIGWIYCAMAVLSGFQAVANRYTQYAVAAGPVGPFGDGAAMAWLAGWTNTLCGGLFVPSLLLFPDGRPPSPRWRLALWLGVLAPALATPAHAFMPGPLLGVPWVMNPFGNEEARGVLAALLAVSTPAAAMILLLVGALLVLRLRGRRADERQQLKWAVYGYAVWVLAWLVTALSPREWVPVTRVGYVLALAFTAACIAVAILRYRLYAIDLVISKTLVYGSLAVCITAIYVGVVAGVGTLVGSRGEANTALALLATVGVAVAFQPLRERLQRLANRLVYGHRASPYEVLAEFSRRIAGAISVDEVLPRLAEAAAHGVGSARSLARVYVPGGKDQAVAWPAGAPSDGFERTVPVLHQGVAVGEIAISKPPGDPVTPAEAALLRDLAAHAGPALGNVRLTLELRGRAEELRASRQRLVTAQDAERRRLERDIHDGAQQQLVAVAVNVQVAQELVRSDPAEAEALLAEIGAQAREALAAMRDLARGIYPPVLADRGIAAALEAQVARAGPLVALAADASVAAARFAPEVEAAVYFCCLEALQNCAKHAPGTPVSVWLGREDGWLGWSMHDAGPGFDAATAPKGAGLQNMADRLAAVGGRLEICSVQGEGTTVTGRVPATP